MKRTWIGLLMVVLGVAGGSSSALAAPAPGGPRLLRQGNPQQGLFAVELPQPDGSVRLAKLEGCTVEQVRARFGLFQAPITQTNDSEDEQLSSPSTLVLPCPDRIPEGSPVFVEPPFKGVSSLQLNAVSAAAPQAHETYLVVPNRCFGHMNHFRIRERAFQQKPGTADSKGQPPPEAERIFLSCGNEQPSNSYTGWQVHKADVLGFDRKLVLLQKGEVSIALDAIDGQSINELVASGGPDAHEAVIRRLRAFFSVPPEVERQEFFLTTTPLDPRLQLPLLDMCLDRCGDARWRPAHKLVLDSMLTCLTGALAPDGETCVDTEPIVVEEKLQLDGSLRRQATRAGLEFPACGTPDTWEQRLGFSRVGEQGSWLEKLEARFLESPAMAGVPAMIALPCLKEPPTCRVELHDGVDLSSLSLPETVKRSCKRGDEVLELVLLGKLARVSDQGSLVVRQAELPPAMRKIRLTGQSGTSSELQVSPPRCGFGAAATCTQARPALLIQGDLEVELSSLKILPTPTEELEPLARIGIQAEGGAAKQLSLRLRHVNIGDGGQKPFYKGLQFSGGSLVLYNTNVWAFTDALAVQHGRVSVTSWPLRHERQLASLAHPSGQKLKREHLRALGGESLAGSVVNFRALALGAKTQAFLAGMKVSGPMNVSWMDDRTEPGEPGLLSMETHFTNGTGFFSTESVMVSVKGRGLLRFEKPEIISFANVLECASRPFPSFPELTPHIVLDRPAIGTAIRFAPRPGICDFDNPFPWIPSSSPEAGS